jgi:hypothetical protein
MLPLEIVDYKTKWLKDCNNISTFDSDLEFDAKRWCRENLKQHQWDFCKFTAVYEHSIYFEMNEFKTEFEKEFRK